LACTCDNAEQKFIQQKQLQEILDEDALMFEYIMLKLRLTEGLDKNKFKGKFNVDFMISMKSKLDIYSAII